MAQTWLQTPLFAPPATWQATPVSKLPAWTDAKRICLDVECRDDDLHELGPGVRRDNAYVCGIAFAIEDGPSHYLPIRHEGGGNLAEEHVWNYIRDQARNFHGTFVFNSAPYDLDWLWENKVETDHVICRDVQVAEPLLDELQKTYNLNHICARRGLPGKDETELLEHAKAWGVHPKKGLWRLHAAAVGKYGIGDVRTPLPLLRKQEEEIEAQNLRETYDVESRLTPALVRMTRRGIRVDCDELDRVETWAKERRANYIDQIHHLTGIRIGSLTKAEEVAKALRQRGIDVPTKVHAGTGKVMATVTKLWLQGLTDEVAKAIVFGREFDKLLGTYVNGVRKHMVKDRIHPSFKQLVGASDEDDGDGDEDAEGARFGRVAAKHPNVQASMKRSKEIQKRWRKVLVPDRGKRWFKVDLGQQEPRITVHYAEICRLPGSRRAGDAFRNDPCFDPYQLMVELCKTPADTDLKQLRDDLKEIYLGRCYGMGGGKIAKKLKLPTVWKTNEKTGYSWEAAGPEAEAIIRRFDRGVPYVKALAEMCKASGQAKKYIIALGNRRVRFEIDENGKIKDEHKAISKLVQGSAAHQTKSAAVALDAAGFPLQITVHDEFGYSGDSEEEAREMGQITCDVVVIRVPFRADIEVGDSYGDLKKIFTVSSKHTTLSLGAAA